MVLQVFGTLEDGELVKLQCWGKILFFQGRTNCYQILNQTGGKKVENMSEMVFGSMMPEFFKVLFLFLKKYSKVVKHFHILFEVLLTNFLC